MSDDELIRLRNDIGTLTDSARVALLAELQDRNLHEAPTESVAPGSVPEKKELSGVGGWLAWLVFVLLIGGPIASIVAVVNEHDITKTPGLDSSVATLSWAIDAVVLIGLAAWSLYCGILLLRLKPNAPKITKAYLIGLFSYAALGVTLTIITGTKSGPDSGDASSAIVPFLRTLVGAIVWYSYLATSKRVKNTYVRA